MGIAQKVSRDFSDAVRSRGQSYFAKGRVAITSASASEVVARVRGTAKYRVRLRLRGGRLHATCSCPYFAPFGDPCKHIWATVLAADARRLLAAAPVRPLKLVSDPPRRAASGAGAGPQPGPGPGPIPGLDPPSTPAPARTAIPAPVPARGPGPHAARGPGPHSAHGPGPRRPWPRPLQRVPLAARPGAAAIGPASSQGSTGFGPVVGEVPAASGARPGSCQAGGPEHEGPAGLHPRRPGDPQPEPGGHRPGPPPAPARGRLGALEALVACACRPAGPVRPRGPRSPGAAGRGEGDSPRPARRPRVGSRRGGGQRQRARQWLGGGQQRRRVDGDAAVRAPE